MCQDTSPVSPHPTIATELIKNENIRVLTGGCIFRDKDNTENCSNPDRTFFISFSLFFILCSMLDINKSHDVGL